MRKFVKSISPNFSNDSLPKVDVTFCRDSLVHLSNQINGILYN